MSTFTDSRDLYRSMLKLFHSPTISASAARSVLAKDVFGNWYPTLLLSREVRSDGTVDVFAASGSGAVFRPSIFGRYISSAWPWLFTRSVPISAVRELHSRPEILQHVCAALDAYFALPPGRECGPEQEALRAALATWERSHLGILTGTIPPATRELLAAATPLTLPTMSRMRSAVRGLLPPAGHSL